MSKTNLAVAPPAASAEPEPSSADGDGPDDEQLAQAEQRLQLAQSVATKLVEGLHSVIVGHEEVVDNVVIALLAGGHVLLEGAPGLGKTQLVRTLSALLGGSFARIQFTSDLMPSDVLGTNLVVTTSSGGKELHYRAGPVFANLLLADEINRATPKTQSALLEAMAERTVSVDGKPRPLPAPFFVLATENPIEMEGVFPLPEAQLDRFLLKLVLRMPDLDTLTAIGARAEEPTDPEPVTTPEQLIQVQAIARAMPAAPHVERYAARLVLATHGLRELRYGAGPRAVQGLLACGRVRALLCERAAVAAEDVRAAAPHVLRHRLVLGFEAEARGLDADHFVGQALASVPVE